MAELKAAEESLTLGPIDPAVFTGPEEEILFSSTTSLFGFSEGGGDEIGEGCLSFQANQSLPQGFGAASGTGDGGGNSADTACPKAPSLLQSLNAVINKTASARKARAAPAAAEVRTIDTSETTNKRTTRKTRKAKPKPSRSPRLATSGGTEAKANDAGLEAGDIDGGVIMTRRRTRSSSRLNRGSRKGEDVVLAVAAGNLPWSPPSPEVKKTQATGPSGRTSDGQGEAIVNKGDSVPTESLVTEKPTRGGDENSYGSPKRKMKLRSSGSDVTEASTEIAAQSAKQSSTDGPVMETDRQAPAPAPSPSQRDNTVGVGGMEFIPGFEDTIDLQFMTTLLQGDEGEAILGSAMDSTDGYEADLQGSLGLADILLRGCDTQSEAPVTKSDSAEDRRNNESGERKENSPACEVLVTQNAAADRGLVSSSGNDAAHGVREAVEVVTVLPRKQTTSQTAPTPTSTLSPTLLPAPVPLSPIPLANVPEGCVASSAKPLLPTPGGSGAEKHGSAVRQKSDNPGVTPSSQLSREGATKDAITVTQSEENVSCESVQGMGKEAVASINCQAGKRCHSGPDRPGPRAIEAMPPPSTNVGVRRCSASDVEKNTTARTGVLQRTAATTPGAENSGETRHQASGPGSSGRGSGDGACPSSSQSVLPRVTDGRIGGSVMSYTEERPGNGVAVPPGLLPRKVSLRFAPRERSTEEKVAKQGYLPFQKLTAPLSKPLEAVFKFMRKKWREVASSDLDNVRIVCDAVTTVESTEQPAANNRATFVWGTERSGDSLARLVNSLPEAARARLCKEEFLDLTYTFVSGTIGPPPCDVSSVWDDSSVPAAVPSSAAPRSSSTSATAATKSHARSAQSSSSLPLPMPPPAAVKDKTRKRARTVDGNENPAAAAAAAAAAASAAAAIAATVTGNREPVLDRGGRKRTRRAPNEEKTQPKSSSGMKEVTSKSKRPGRYPRSIRPTVSLADAVCGRSLVGDSLAARLAEMASRSGGLAGKMFAAMHSMAVADGLRTGQPTDWASWPPMNTFAATLSAPWLSSAAFPVNNGARSALGPAAVGTATAPASGSPVTENPVQKLDEVSEAPAVTDGVETDGKDVSLDEIIGENSCMAAFGGCDVDLLTDRSPSPSGSEEAAGAGAARTVTDQETNAGSTDGNTNEASESGKRPQGDGIAEVISAAGPPPPRQESYESAPMLGAQPTETRLDQRVTDGTNTGGCEKRLSPQDEQIRTVSMSPAAGMMTAVLDTPEASVTVEAEMEGDVDPVHPTTSSERAKEVSLSRGAHEIPHRDSTLALKDANPSGMLRRASVTPGATQESDAGLDTPRLASHPKPVPVPPAAVETPCVSSRSEISMHSARSEREENRSCTGPPSTPQPSSCVGGANGQKNACASGRVEPRASSSSGCFQAEPPLDAENSAAFGTEEDSPCRASETGCSIFMEAAAVFASGVADGSEVGSDRKRGVSHSDAEGGSFGRPSAGEQPELFSKETQEAPSPDASAQVLPQEARVTASVKRTRPPAAASANSTNTDATITTASSRASGSTPLHPRPFDFAAEARNDADRTGSPACTTASEAAPVLTSMNTEPPPVNNARSASNVAASALTPETPQSCDLRSALIGGKAIENATREQVQASYAEAWSSFPNCCFLEESLARNDAGGDAGAGAGGDAKHMTIGEDLMERWLALPHAEVALDGMISISPVSTPGSDNDGKGLKGLTPTMGGFFAISPRRDSSSFVAVSPRRDHTPVSASSCRSGSCCSDDLRRSRATERATEKTDSLPTLIRLGRSMSKGLTPVRSVKVAVDARNSGTTEGVAIVAANPDSAPGSTSADSASNVTTAGSTRANGGGSGDGGGGDIVNHSGRTSTSSDSGDSGRKRRNCDNQDSGKDTEDRIGHGSRGGENKGVDVLMRPKKRSKKARIKPTFVGSLQSAALPTGAPAFSRG